MVKIRHAYWKSLRRDIRHSLSRFLAIFAIVALGVGFLAGLMSNGAGHGAGPWTLFTTTPG